MPAQSSNSSVHKWPDPKTVHEAVVNWAGDILKSSSSITRIGYAGSYARGNWGVGSDVDLVVLVDASNEAFTQRALPIDAIALPVPADVVVYTEAEWVELRRRSKAFEEVVWCFERGLREYEASKDERESVYRRLAD